VITGHTCIVHSVYSVGPISNNSLINLCTLYVNALGRECRVIFGIQGHIVLCSENKVLLKLFGKNESGFDLRV
jgi:hypothetical protein